MPVPADVISCEAPGHSVALAGVTVIVGMFFTVMVLLVVFTHPSPDVPVMLYVVVISGCAITDEPIVADRPVAGAQENEAPPLTDRVVVSFLQMDDLETVTITAGNVLTVISAEAVLVRLLQKKEAYVSA